MTGMTYARIYPMVVPGIAIHRFLRPGIPHPLSRRLCIRLKSMRTASLFALLFQLAWSTVVPVIHAESEALSSQAHYESKHSDDCVRLHDPAHSATCSAVSAPLSKTVRYQLQAPGQALPVAASSGEGL